MNEVSQSSLLCSSCLLSLAPITGRSGVVRV
jgi:hypothetical protein